MKRILDNLLQRWKALAPQRRILLAAALATVVVGGYVLMSRANRVEWAVLYANVDDATASDVMASLDAKGIEYELDGNGTRILVPAEDLNTTRIALANEGISGQAVPDGFAEIFDNQGLSTTDFAQKVNYERALEGELARTLLSMDAVSGANVQLSIPEKSIFVGSPDTETDKPTASVLLQLKRPMTDDEVDTVANVVSSSVPGLDIAQITVASTDGTLLKSPGEPSTAGGSTSLELTQAYESRLQQQLTQLVRNIPGAQNATVSVTAELTFAQSTVQRETIDPTNNATVAEQTSEEHWEGEGATYPGGAVGVDGGPIDTGGGTSVYDKTETTTQTQIGDRTVSSTTDSTPVVKRLGIAVVIPATADAADALDPDAINAIVSAAANVDPARNDTVEVAVVPTTAPAATADEDVSLVTEPVPQPTGGVSPYLIVVAFLIGAILVIILGIIRRRRKAKRAAAAEAAEKLAALGADPTLANYLNLSPEKAPKEKRGKREKVKKKRGKHDEDEAEQTELVPVVAEQAQDQQAMDEIRADLEKLLAESPDSLANLLSNWMTK